MTSKLTAARLAFTNRSTGSAVSVLGNAAFMRTWAGRRWKALRQISATAKASGDASGSENAAQEVSAPAVDPNQPERPAT